MAVGVRSAGTPEYLFFTDADVRFPTGALTALVTTARRHGLDVVSQMVRLRAISQWERHIVPAFVYFFAQLYPFSRVNQPESTTAAAAGGCMLVRREALQEAGGLACIAGALIDDVALGHLVKGRRPGSRIWLGLSSEIESVRPYPRLSDLWAMISRSAYTQLRYSPWLLAGTVLGLLLVYVVPPAATVAGLVAGDALRRNAGRGRMDDHGRDIRPDAALLPPVAGARCPAAPHRGRLPRDDDRLGSAAPPGPRWRLEGPNRDAIVRRLINRSAVVAPRVACRRRECRRMSSWRPPSTGGPPHTRR